MWTLCLLFAADPAYAKPEMIVEPAELIRSAGKVLILDARSKMAYEVGHVSGAVRVDVDGWAKAMTAMEDAKAWGRRLAAAGVGGDRPVVVYGTVKTVDPVRVWWILRYWGLKDVRVLNGGWEAYLKAGGHADKRDTPVGDVKPPALKAQAERLATKEQILAGLKDGKLGPLIDARSENEHCGLTKSAKRNGAVPEAKHLEWRATLDADGRFKSAAELAKLFREAGLDPSKPATTYCQSGGRASVMAFVVELMSGQPARNYYRSWSEWGNDEKTPVVKTLYPCRGVRNSRITSANSSGCV